MYTVTLVLPATKEGKEEVRRKYTRLLAGITCEKLTFEQIEMLIEILEKEQ